VTDFETIVSDNIYGKQNLSYKIRLHAPLKYVIGRATAVNVREIHEDECGRDDRRHAMFTLFTMPSLFQFSVIRYGYNLNCPLISS